MGSSVRGWTRRSFLLSSVAATKAAAAADSRGSFFPTESHRFPDPLTEFDVYRLTDPAHASWLPAYYNRAFTRRATFLLFASDRTGSPQAFRMDLKTEIGRAS